MAVGGEYRVADRPVAIDISQLFNLPLRSGVQRVLEGLLGNWPHHSHSAECVFQARQRLYSCPVHAVSEALTANLASKLDTRESEELFRQTVWASRTESLRERELPKRYRSWLLPEPTYEPVALARIRELSSHMVTGAIAMDILPELNADQTPPTPRHSYFSHYFRTLCAVTVVIAISERSATDVKLRLRRAGQTWTATPGVDHLPKLRLPAAQPVTFVSVGTLSPRKRVDLLVQGFQRATESNDAMRLLIIGRPGPGSEKTVEAIEAAQKRGVPIEWVADASDSDLVDAISRATASFSLGVEGFGLPALESLRLGCPVVVSTDVPSVLGEAGAGVLSVEAMSETAVAGALVSLADPDWAVALRAQIRQDELPTWADFSLSVASHL